MKKKLTIQTLALAMASVALALGVTVARADTGLIDFSTTDLGAYPGPGFNNIHNTTHAIGGLPAGVTVTYTVVYPTTLGTWDGIQVGNDATYAPTESDNSADNGIGYLRLFNFTSSPITADLTFNGGPVSLEQLDYSAYGAYSYLATAVQFVGSLGGVQQWNSGVLAPTGGTPWVWTAMTAGAGILIDKLEITGAPSVSTIDQIQLNYIPEPASLALLGLGALVLLVRRPRV